MLSQPPLEVGVASRILLHTPTHRSQMCTPFAPAINRATCASDLPQNEHRNFARCGASSSQLHACQGRFDITAKGPFACQVLLDTTVQLVRGRTSLSRRGLSGVISGATGDARIRSTRPRLLPRNRAPSQTYHTTVCQKRQRYCPFLQTHACCMATAFPRCEGLSAWSQLKRRILATFMPFLEVDRKSVV